MKRPTLLLLLAVPLCANHVPGSSERQLTAKSDLVVIGRVIAIGLPAPPSPPDREERGAIAIGSTARAPCARVSVERRLKGRAGARVTVCASRSAEMDPTTPVKGRRYRMFLRKTGTVYVAVSWDGLRTVGRP